VRALHAPNARICPAAATATGALSLPSCVRRVCAVGRSLVITSTVFMPMMTMQVTVHADGREVTMRESDVFRPPLEAAAAHLSERRVREQPEGGYEANGYFWGARNEPTRPRGCRPPHIPRHLPATPTPPRRGCARR
jgi:hypothetical protein